MRISETSWRDLNPGCPAGVREHRRCVFAVGIGGWPIRDFRNLTKLWPPYCDVSVFNRVDGCRIAQ
jgi:hypothetical protein